MSGPACGPVWAVNRNSEDFDHFVPDGTDLGGFALGFQPGDVAVDPLDGSLWISHLSDNTLGHYQPPTGSMPNALLALADRDAPIDALTLRLRQVET